MSEASRLDWHKHNTPSQDDLQLNGDRVVASQPDDDFQSLLARVRGGDESAAGELVRRYEKVVLRSVRSRLGKSMRGAMDSMDVMQSVHRSLLTGLKNKRFQFASPQQLIGLAMVMVQRKVARHWRKLNRIPGAGRGAGDASAATPLEAIASDESTPAELATANDLLERFLSQLDELDRQLVRLKAAEILGREPAFIRMRWSRLRQMLREGGHLDA
jgi:DNA-directed RNA polymerase specialized sigma24 family protein